MIKFSCCTLAWTFTQAILLETSVPSFSNKIRLPNTPIDIYYVYCCVQSSLKYICCFFSIFFPSNSFFLCWQCEQFWNHRCMMCIKILCCIWFLKIRSIWKHLGARRLLAYVQRFVFCGFLLQEKCESACMNLEDWHYRTLIGVVSLSFVFNTRLDF